MSLDMDVHLQLAKHKRRTGLAIKDIANNILRCALSRSGVFHEILGHVLVTRGFVTPDDFAEAIEVTLQQLRELSVPDTDILPTGESATSEAGSWEITAVCGSIRDDYLIVEECAMDSRRRPTPMHVHETDQHIQVLAGNLLLQLSESEVLLSASDHYCIPGGEPHALTPLSRDTRILSSLV